MGALGLWPRECVSLIRRGRQGFLMANRVNRWLLRRVLYLTSLYFMLSSGQGSNLYTSMIWELNYLVAQFELSPGWSLFFTTLEILLIAFLLVLIAAFGVMAAFRKAGSRLGGRLHAKLG